MDGPRSLSAASLSHSACSIKNPSCSVAALNSCRSTKKITPKTASWLYEVTLHAFITQTHGKPMRFEVSVRLRMGSVPDYHSLYRSKIAYTMSLRMYCTHLRLNLNPYIRPTDSCKSGSLVPVNQALESKPVQFKQFHIAR